MKIITLILILNILICLKSNQQFLTSSPKFTALGDISLEAINNRIYEQNMKMLNQGIFLNPGGEIKMYNFSDQPDFLAKSANIDFNLIILGLQNSRELSRKLNFSRSSTRPCSNCSGKVDMFNLNINLGNFL